MKTGLPAMAVALTAAVALTGALGPATARANGAFPDASQVLLPTDRPDTFIVGTNFGLIISDDGGVQWRWICEHDQSLGGYLYQQAAAPSGRLFALAADGLVFSDTAGCAWQALVRGDLYVFDYFPDPGTAGRVLLLAARQADRLVIESTDNGATVGRVLYTAPVGQEVRTIEISRADPRVIVATEVPQVGGRTSVLRSDDGGAKWAVQSTATNSDELLIAGIDPADPQRIYFRVYGRAGDRVALSEDGGKTIKDTLSVPGLLTAFVRRANGNVLVGSSEGNDGRVYRSTDGGRTFQVASTAIHPRALGERAGKLFAVTDNAIDGFALAVSPDDGANWQRVMAFEDVGTIATCPGRGANCTGVCLIAAQQRVLRTEICGASPADGGIDGGDAGDEGTAAASGGGCGCGLGARPGADRAGLAIGLLAGILWWTRRLLWKRN